MAQRINNPAIHHVDKDTGAPLSGGQLFFFEINSTTPKDTFSDQDGTIPNTNPVILDAAGVEPDIFGVGSYRIVLQNAVDVQQWERDPVNFEISGAQWDDWLATVDYAVNDIVEASNGFFYSSIQTPNINNDPTISPTFWNQTDLVTRWNPNRVYNVRDIVSASDFTLYLSQVSSNVGNDPVSSPTEWLPSGAGTGGSFAFAGWDLAQDYGIGGTAIVTGSDGEYYKSIQTPNLNNDPTTPSPAFWEEVTFIEQGNITIEGDTIASTVTDSNIDITPNGTGILTVNGVEVANTTQLALKAPLLDPTFTGDIFSDGNIISTSESAQSFGVIRTGGNLATSTLFTGGNSGSLILSSLGNVEQRISAVSATMVFFQNDIERAQFDGSGNLKLMQNLTLEDNQAIELGINNDLSMSSIGGATLFDLAAGVNWSIREGGVTKYSYLAASDVFDYFVAVRLKDGINLIIGDGSDGELRSDGNNVILNLSASADLLLMDAGVVKYQYNNSTGQHIFDDPVVIEDTGTGAAELILKNTEGIFIIENDNGGARFRIADADGGSPDNLINFLIVGSGATRTASVQLFHTAIGSPTIKLETTSTGGTLTGTWIGTCPSDLALKKNVTPVAGLSTIRKLDGITWEWIDPITANQEQELVGFSAQSYRLAYPSQVYEVDGFLRIEHKVSSQRLNADLVEAVKQLDDKVSDLMARIAVLEGDFT